MNSTKSSAVTVAPAERLRGNVQVPGDKSISHRYAMLAALAAGTSTISGYSTGADCQSTLSCLKSLGVDIDSRADVEAFGQTVVVHGAGLGSLQRADLAIDTGNSGTTMRLLAGILAGHPFNSVLTGDSSLQQRPMKRIIDPLQRMGARVEAPGGHAPLTIRGAELKGIAYTPPVASAQVKSAILLAGLHANGTTRVHEPAPTRDHSERALKAFGAQLTISENSIAVTGGTTLRPANLTVPGDPSSAAFWLVAAAAVPGSDITINNVSLNPTRLGYLYILERAGANIKVTTHSTSAGEPFGSIRVQHRALRHISVSSSEVPGLIDELPALGALAVHGGAIDVSGATELRHKESDRITAFSHGLKNLGADVEERHDGFRVTHNGPITGGLADAAGDHRLAMAFAIAALAGKNPSTIKNASAVRVSYPGFFAILESLRG